MQDIMPENVSVVLNGLHDHVCNGWLAQVERTIAGFVQQPVHGGKCLPGVDRAGRESPVGRQTIVETPREEDGPFRVIDVRKSPPGECHTRVVPRALRNSHLLLVSGLFPASGVQRDLWGRPPGLRGSPWTRSPAEESSPLATARGRPGGRPQTRGSAPPATVLWFASRRFRWPASLPRAAGRRPPCARPPRRTTPTRGR